MWVVASAYSRTRRAASKNGAKVTRQETGTPAESCGKHVEIPDRLPQGREKACRDCLSKRTQGETRSGANGTIRPISKTKAGYKFFLYRGLEIQTHSRSGTPLASLSVEATFVASLAYWSVPVLLLPPEIHSPELSPNPFCSCRIQRQRCPALALYFSQGSDSRLGELCGPRQHRVYCGEAL